MWQKSMSLKSTEQLKSTWVSSHTEFCNDIVWSAAYSDSSLYRAVCAVMPSVLPLLSGFRETKLSASALPVYPVRALYRPNITSLVDVMSIRNIFKNYSKSLSKEPASYSQSLTGRTCGRGKVWAWNERAKEWLTIKVEKMTMISWKMCVRKWANVQVTGH